MRIALFTDSDVHYSDGVARIVQELVRHIDRHPEHCLLVFHRSLDGTRNVEPSVATVGVHSAALPIPGYDVYPWFYLRSPRRILLRHARAFKPDVLLTVTPYIPRGIGSAAFYLSRKLRLPVVGSFDVQLGMLAEYYLKEIFRIGLVVRFFRWYIGRRMGVFRRCANILVPSLSVDRHVHESCPGIPTVLFRRAVDTHAFHPRYRSQEFRARYGLSGKAVILFVGRLALEKNLRALGRIYGRLKQRQPSTALLIVGEGPERAALQAMGLEDMVFTGLLTGAELATAYASGDMFAFPSLAEAGPLVILEAMASGLPVVVAGTGGAYEDVADEETGFVVADMQGFEDRLELLVTNAERRRCMGAAGRRFAMTRSWETVWAAVLGALAGSATNRS